MPRPLTELQIAQIHQMREDGHTAEATARAVGCTGRTVRRYVPGYLGKVPNDRLREAFLASRRSAADVARALGWDTGKGADTSRVRRALGLTKTNSSGHLAPRRRIDWETGSLIAQAIGVPPREVLDRE